MKTANTLIIITGSLFCAFAPLTRAECTQSCSEVVDQYGDTVDNILWGTEAGGTGTSEIGIGFQALKNNTGSYNVANRRRLAELQ